MHKHQTAQGTTWNTKIRTLDVTETPHLMSTTQVLFFGYERERSALTLKRSKQYVRILVEIKVQAFQSTALRHTGGSGGTAPLILSPDTRRSRL